MNNSEKEQLINNIVSSMRSVPRAIQLMQIEHFLKADREYGLGVARGLELKL